MAKEPQISTGPEWAGDALPACAVGMDLLRRLEAARPNDYAFLQAQDFVDLGTSAFVGIPEWDAFIEHCETCGIATVGDLYALELSALEDHFGSYGLRLYQLARGVDRNPVVPNRVSKSISAEDTFAEDIPLADTEPQIRRLAEKVWKSSHGNARAAKTVVLKLKTKEFNSLTRSLTLPAPPASCDELTGIALALRERVEMGPKQLFRLVGVGLSNFQAAEDSASPLFDEEPVEGQ